MTREKVIQTLIDDYSKQAKLSKREQTIFEHGLLTGIQIGSTEKPEADLENAFIDKACEWLKKNRKNYSSNALGEEYFIDDFKKAMKGG